MTDKDDLGATTQVVTYAYDVFNRRIARAVDTSSPFDMEDAFIERYILDDAAGVASLDGGNVILDFVDPDGPEGTASIELAKRYLYGPAVDQILAQENVSVSLSADSRVLWPMGDHLQTTRDLVDQAGAMEEHFEYDSYGNVTSGDITLTRYLFTAREFDEATGLQYNRARWYDAGVGRWVSEDPLGFNGHAAQLLLYGEGSPQQASDPSGLIPPQWTWLRDENSTPVDPKPLPAPKADGVHHGAPTTGGRAFDDSNPIQFLPKSGIGRITVTFYRESNLPRDPAIVLKLEPKGGGFLRIDPVQIAKVSQFENGKWVPYMNQASHPGWKGIDLCTVSDGPFAGYHVDFNWGSYKDIGPFWVPSTEKGIERPFVKVNGKEIYSTPYLSGKPSGIAILSDEPSIPFSGSWRLDATTGFWATKHDGTKDWIGSVAWAVEWHEPSGFFAFLKAKTLYAFVSGFNEDVPGFNECLGLYYKYNSNPRDKTSVPPVMRR